jgi:ribosomal-protein-alanine N-acetyltransferase
MSAESTRIRLHPFAPDDLLALIDGAPQFETRLGIKLADGVRDFFVSGDVSPAWLEALRASKSADPWKHGFAVVERASETIIGTAGFKGAPDSEGVVEIAYGIVPAKENRGFATEAATALVVRAFDEPRVRAVRAHTLPTPNASTHVLTKCRFTYVGEFEDPEDGRVWRWERERNRE